MNRMKRFLVGILLAASCVGFAMPVGAADNSGWMLDTQGWWYAYSDGSYPYNGWEYINQEWYLFDAKGYMKTGWQYTGGKWYYLESSGKMVTGWKQLDGKWYYLDPAQGGAMATGFLNLGMDTYYLEKDGSMRVDPLDLDGFYYLFDTTGRMIYQGQKGQFHYDLPEGWNLGADMGNTVILLPESMDGSNVIITGIDLGEMNQTVSLRDLQKELEDQMENILSEYMGGLIQDLNMTSSRLFGAMTKEALEFRLTYTFGGMEIKANLFVLSFDNQLIEICYTSTEQLFDNYRNEIRTFAKSVAPGEMVQNG